MDTIGDIGGLNDALHLIFEFFITLVLGSSHYLFAVQNIFAVSREEYKAKFKVKSYTGETAYEKLLKKLQNKDYKKLEKADAIVLA